MSNRKDSYPVAWPFLGQAPDVVLTFLGGCSLINAKALPGAYVSCPGYIAQLKMFSIHRLASVSLTLPRYLWVVERLACRRIILLTISIGAPDLLAYVAACRLRSWGAISTPIMRPAFLTISRAPL